MDQLSNTNTLIYNAGSIAGYHCARAVAMAGSRPLLIGDDEKSLSMAKKRIQEIQDGCIAYVSDPRDPSQFIQVQADLQKKEIPIHTLIYHSDVVHKGDFMQLSATQWNQDVTKELEKLHAYIAHFSLALQRSGSSIIFVQSIFGSHVPTDDSLVHFQATKSAIFGMMRGLASSLAKKNIRVNMIELGYFQQSAKENKNATIANSIPLNRLGGLEEIESAVVYFASTKSSYTTGQVLRIDGGLCL